MLGKECLAGGNPEVMIRELNVALVSKVPGHRVLLSGIVVLLEMLIV